uniref:non-specific serine/threonine protein kinase n=1 Tax=Poecilia latipinna TaxID=48699 RepID=A0A3B3UM24_9TELE
MQKSSSFDDGVGFSHTNVPPHRRSRSLDEYSRRSPSSASHESAHEEEASHSTKEEITYGEAAGRNSLIFQKAPKVSGRRGSVALTQGVFSGSSLPSEFLAGGRMRSRLGQDQTEGDTLTSSQGSLAEQRQLVLREYQLLRRLHHPHLVQLYAAFITPLYVLLLKYFNNVAELLHQIVSAADYLHSRRVIHLDLKSDNMLVDDGNHLKIIDFGSAQSFVPGQPLNIEHIHGFSFFDNESHLNLFWVDALLVLLRNTWSWSNPSL